MTILLQEIYRRRSKLIVVFLGSDWPKKGRVRHRVQAGVREFILERDHARIISRVGPNWDVGGQFAARIR